jgi:hypothetical protein
MSICFHKMRFVEASPTVNQKFTITKRCIRCGKTKIKSYRWTHGFEGF